MADVPSPAPFSAYPGIDRFIACLAGPGLNLELAGASVPVPFEGEALRFSGEDAAAGRPLGPGVRDLNLMLRRDRWRGRMILARERTLALDAPLVLVHAPDGFPALRATGSGGSWELLPGRTLVASGRVALFAAPGSAAVGCELTPA